MAGRAAMPSPATGGKAAAFPLERGGAEDRPTGAAAAMMPAD
jgi:hypothetical protein